MIFKVLSLSFELCRRSRRLIVFSITDKREIENGSSDTYEIVTAILVSISSTFCIQIFCTNIVSAAFSTYM